MVEVILLALLPGVAHGLDNDWLLCSCRTYWRPVNVDGLIRYRCNAAADADDDNLCDSDHDVLILLSVGCLFHFIQPIPGECNWLLSNPNLVVARIAADDLCQSVAIFYLIWHAAEHLRIVSGNTNAPCVMMGDKAQLCVSRLGWLHGLICPTESRCGSFCGSSFMSMVVSHDSPAKTSCCAWWTVMKCESIEGKFLWPYAWAVEAFEYGNVTTGWKSYCLQKLCRCCVSGKSFWSAHHIHVLT